MIMHNKGVNISIINRTMKYMHANIVSMYIKFPCLNPAATVTFHRGSVSEIYKMVSTTFISKFIIIKIF